MILAVFLDIQGAFDSAPFEKIAQVLANRRVSPCITRLIMAMLEQRSAQAELGTARIKVRVKKGLAQGGVLSTILWNLLMDTLLQRLHQLLPRTPPLGFADDLCIYIRGMDIRTLCELMQQILRMVESWCNEFELSASPEKTEMILFSVTGKDIPVSVRPTLFGETLDHSETVKYLGVRLDRKLLFNTHLEEKIRKATVIYWQSRRTFGRTWGIKPRVVGWLFTKIIRPYISYGVSSWYRRLDLKTVQTILTKFQGMILRGITGSMRSTPCAAMEMLLNIPPLHLFLRAEAEKTLSRISLVLGRRIEFGDGRRSKKTRELVQPSLQFVACKGIDTIVPKIMFEHEFTVVIPQRDEWIEGQVLLDQWTVAIYTDGSLMNGKASAAFYCDDPSLQVSIPLGTNVSVFQAEVLAIREAVMKLLTYGLEDEKICVYSDSQAALQAINSFTVTSKLVWECLIALNELGRRNRLRLCWVPGHCGIMGNEMADRLAREATLTPFNGAPVVSISFDIVRCKIKERLVESQERLWSASLTCRQSKMFVRRVDRKISRYLMELKRHELRALVQVITGHGPFFAHLETMGLANTRMCQRCLSGEETAEHYIGGCPGYELIRFEIFGSGQINAKDFGALRMEDLLKFIKRTRRLEY